VGEPAEIRVVEHAGAGDVAFEADYSTVYRPLAPSAEEQTAGLREELAALQSQLQAERWQADRDEARAVIVDLLARVNAVTAHS
jgi:hypothetical protein